MFSYYRMCSLTIECVLLLQVESQTMVLWLVITEVSGCPFLTRALGPIINNILNSRESFELDPREADFLKSTLYSAFL